MTFRPEALNAVAQLQSAVSAAINDVNRYYANWNGNGPKEAATLLLLSQQNDTVWRTYSALTSTLANHAGAFWTAMTATVDAMPALPPLRLRLDRLTPILPLVGNRCPWCLTPADVGVLTIVQSRMMGYVGAALNNYISWARGSLDYAYQNYLVDVWIANISSTVTSNDRYIDNI